MAGWNSNLTPWGHDSEQLITSPDPEQLKPPLNPIFLGEHASTPKVYKTC